MNKVDKKTLGTMRTNAMDKNKTSDTYDCRKMQSVVI